MDRPVEVKMGQCNYGHDAPVRSLFLPDGHEVSLCEWHWQHEMREFVNWNEMQVSPPLPVIGWISHQCRFCLKQIGCEYYGFGEINSLCRRCACDKLFEDMRTLGKYTLWLDVKIVKTTYTKSNGYRREERQATSGSFEDGWGAFHKDLNYQLHIGGTNWWNTDRFDIHFSIPGDEYLWWGCAKMGTWYGTNSGRLLCKRTKSKPERWSYTCHNCGHEVNHPQFEYYGTCDKCGTSALPEVLERHGVQPIFREED